MKALLVISHQLSLQKIHFSTMLYPDGGSKSDSGDNKKRGTLTKRGTSFFKADVYAVGPVETTSFMPKWYLNASTTYSDVLKLIDEQGGAYISHSELELVYPMGESENQLIFMEEINDWCKYFIHYYSTAEEKSKRTMKSGNNPKPSWDTAQGLGSSLGFANTKKKDLKAGSYDRVAMRKLTQFLYKNLSLTCFFGKVSNEKGRSRLRFILYCSFLMELDAETPNKETLTQCVNALEHFDRGSGATEQGKYGLAPWSVFHGPIAWVKNREFPWLYYSNRGAGKTWIDHLNCDLDYDKEIKKIMVIESSRFHSVPIFLGCISFSLVLGDMKIVSTLLENHHSAQACKTEKIYTNLKPRGSLQKFKDSTNVWLENLGQELRLEGTTTVWQPYDFAMVWWKSQIADSRTDMSEKAEAWRKIILKIETASARSKKRANRKCMVAILKILIFHAWKIWVVMVMLDQAFGVSGVNFYTVKNGVMNYVADVELPACSTRRFVDIRNAEGFYEWTETRMLDLLFTDHCNSVLYDSSTSSSKCQGVMHKANNERWWQSNRFLQDGNCRLFFCSGQWTLVEQSDASYPCQFSSFVPLTKESMHNIVDASGSKIKNASVLCVPGPINSESMFIVGETVRIRHVTLSQEKADEKCWNYPGTSARACFPVYRKETSALLAYEMSHGWKNQWEVSDQNITGVKYVKDFRPFSSVIPNRHYPLGGHYVDLHIQNKSEAKLRLRRLRESKWIDVLSGCQAAFVEFSVWISKAGVLVPVRLSVEFAPGTGAVPSLYSSIFPVLSDISALPRGVYTTYFAILVALPLMKEGAQLLIERWAYFRNGWSLLELTVLGLTQFFLQWYTVTLQVSSEITIKSDQYNNFESLEIRLKWLLWGAGVGMTLTVFQMLETFKTLADPYGLQIAGIMATISRAEILGILGLMFGILFAFSYGQFVTFGNDVRAYNTVASSLESMMFVIFGEFGDQLNDSQRVWSFFASIVFILFIMLIGLVMMNILIALVGEIYHDSLIQVALERDLSRFNENYKCINQSVVVDPMIELQPMATKEADEQESEQYSDFYVEILARTMGEKRRFLIEDSMVT